MRTIYKYTLPSSSSYVTMPKGARVLHAGRDPATGNPCIWALVDTEAFSVKRLFRFYGTGWEIEDGDVLGHYVGTAICDGLVWHIFDVGEV